MTALFLFGIHFSITAQTNFSIEESGDNSVKLSGTSTLHDWMMVSAFFSGDAQFELEPGTHIVSLKKLEFNLPVTSLKSDEKKLDKNAYKALKAKQFPKIQYKMTAAKVSPEKDYKYVIKTVGQLNVAGVSKEVLINISCMANKNGSITCTGTYHLKMADYNVEPPKFMGGLMTTGDNVTLDFSMRFER